MTLHTNGMNLHESSDTREFWNLSEEVVFNDEVGIVVPGEAAVRHADLKWMDSDPFLEYKASVL